MKVISSQVLNYSSMLSFRRNNCDLRSSSCSFFFKIPFLTSCSSFKCSSYTFSMFLSLCPCSLTVSELQFGSFACSSLKRLSSCLFSEVFLPLSNSTILSGPTERYYEVDDKLSFKMTSLEASTVCSLAWILSPESIPPTIDTREIFSFPSIWVISSSTSVHSIAPPTSLLSFGVLALVADDKLFLGSWWEPGGY